MMPSARCLGMVFPSDMSPSDGVRAGLGPTVPGGISFGCALPAATASREARSEYLDGVYRAFPDDCAHETSLDRAGRGVRSAASKTK
jgi:hypothetical protein